MQKQDINILIVDDDVTLGKAMSAVLTRAGFKTILVTKPADAVSAIKFQPVHAAVIDCMLPKMSGRDLAMELRKETTEKLPIVLVSGIYKDKSFIRDALKSTGAVAFLTKPFDLEDFKGEVENALKGFIEIPKERLQQFLSTIEIGAKERVDAVDEAVMVHGFDLPWIFSLLMHPKISGHLNLVSADGEVSAVTFANGEIVQVYQEDLKSYFGTLLVEHGFVSQKDLDEVMKATPAPATGAAKRMGERLIEANVLSPHAVDVVMVEQQGLRLSKLVANTSVNVSFIETELVQENARTDRYAFTQLLNEWLISKISRDWLKSYYMPWLHFKVRKGAEYSDHHTALSIPAVLNVPSLMTALLSSPSLETALEKLGCPEDSFYRGLHALVVCRVICFNEAETKADFDTMRNRLQKLVITLDNQSYFERLGVSPKAKDNEIRRAFTELAKALHPDKVAAEAPADVVDLAKQCFERVSTAYETLTNNEAKTKYLNDLEKGRAESILRAEQLSEQARPLLSKGNITGARRMLEQSIELATPSSITRLLLLWSKLKSPNAERDAKLPDHVKEELAKIPPEDRHDTLYFFVKGLYLKILDDTEGAKRNFDHVIAQEPEFIDARRELNALSMSQTKSTNILSGDLKDVVGMFFRKKK